jgi:hypothetical protein
MEAPGNLALPLKLSNVAEIDQNRITARVKRDCLLRGDGLYFVLGRFD